ncbi:MAG: YqhA family protein [Chloroflexi bacterium]|nr:YqhA family protein [Chloroflexota bacterium]
MSKLLAGTRYLVVVPVIGLSLAAAAFFVFGGLGLIKLLFDALLHGTEAHGDIPFEVEVVEYVHTFLIGTVLYITAVGLYQLFVEEIKFPGGWLKIDSTEELETNLIGVTVVVLAVNFMGIVFSNDADLLLKYGAGIALPIAALALFVGLRTWSTNLTRSQDESNQENVKQGETGEG